MTSLLRFSSDIGIPQTSIKARMKLVSVLNRPSSSIEVLALRPCLLQKMRISTSYVYHGTSNIDHNTDPSLIQTGSSIDPEEKEISEKTSMGKGILSKVHQANQLTSLDEAIVLLRDILARPLVCPAPGQRTLFLGCLARGLVARFYCTDQIQDLDEAIQLFRESLTLLLEARSAYLASRNNLVAALLTRYGITSNMLDLLEIASLRSLTALQKPTPEPTSASGTQYMI